MPHYKYNEINKITWRTRFWKWRKYKWVQLKNWWFFTKRIGQKQCKIRYPHEFPGMPCMRCSPKEWNALQKQRRKQRELVGDLFEDKKNFDV